MPFVYFIQLQAFSHVKPKPFSDDAQHVLGDENDETKTDEQEDDLVEADTHRSTLYKYNQ